MIQVMLEQNINEYIIVHSFYSLRIMNPLIWLVQRHKRIVSQCFWIWYLYSNHTWMFIEARTTYKKLLKWLVDTKSEFQELYIL